MTQRSRTGDRCMVAVLGVVLASCGAGGPTAEEAADIALVNGKIITVDAADSVAEAVAAKDLNNLYRTSCYFADSERYVAFCALYAVMRIVDDRIDDVLARGCIPDEANRERGVLDAWQRLITALLEGEPPDDATASPGG